MSIETEEFLAHYGVKGMKWGVTRSNPSGGSGGGGSIKKAYVKALTTKSKDGNVGVMSPDGKYRVNTGAERAQNKYDRGSSGVKDSSGKKMSRKELRELNRKNEREFDSKKIADVYEESKRGGERVLVESSFDRGFSQTVMTGKQFVDYMEGGGMIEPRSTRVFARQVKEGEAYVLNELPNLQYKPIKRR